MPSNKTSLTILSYIHEDTLPVPVLVDWMDFVGRDFIEDFIIIVGTVDGVLPERYKKICRDYPIVRFLPMKHFGLPPFKVEPRGVLEAYRQCNTLHYLLVKFDTLPWRQGNDQWLRQIIAILTNEDYFAFSGSFYLRFAISAGKDFVKLQRYSNNFAIGNTSNTLKVYEDHLIQLDNDFSNWIRTGEEKHALRSLEQATNRFVSEHAIEEYLQGNGKFVLSKIEDQNWTVFHINQWGEDLLMTRDNFQKRIDIENFLNTRQFYYGSETIAHVKDEL